MSCSQVGQDEVNDSTDGTPQDLLHHVAQLERQYQQEKLDRDRETRFNRDIQIHEIELMEQISRIKNIMVSG